MNVFKHEDFLSITLRNLASHLTKSGYYVTEKELDNKLCIKYNQTKPRTFHYVSYKILRSIIQKRVYLYNNDMGLQGCIDYLKEHLEYVSYKAIRLYTKVEENSHFSDPNGFNAKLGHRTVR